MVASITEVTTGTDNLDISSNHTWVDVLGNMQRLSAVWRGGDTLNHRSRCSTDLDSVDHKVKAKVAAALATSSSCTAAVCARYDAVTDTCIALRVANPSSGSDTLAILEVVAGVATVIETVDITYVADDEIELEVVGTSVIGRHNGVQVVPATGFATTTITTGTKIGAWTRAATSATRAGTYVKGPISAEVVGGSAIDLVVQDSSHGHSAETAPLTQVHELAVADAAHGHTADAQVLVQQHSLAVADTVHVQQADAPQLTQAHQLAVADSLHGHATDGVTLDSAAVLVVQDAAHAHAVDATALTQAHLLAVAGADHGHTLEHVTLAQLHQLAIADAAHAHMAPGLTLTQLHELAVADAIHAHLADNIVVNTDLPDSTVPRPDAGTVARPSLGPVARQAAGTVTRPRIYT